MALPAGDAPSTIVEALALVGAIAAPARTSSAPSAHGLLAPRTRAPWPAASAPKTTTNRPAVRAPPPWRVATAPPTSEPRSHRANSGPGAAGRPGGRGQAHFDDHHLRRMRGVYARKRQAVVAALAHHAPGVELRGLSAGIHAVARLPAGADERAVATAAAPAASAFTRWATTARPRSTAPRPSWSWASAT